MIDNSVEIQVMAVIEDFFSARAMYVPCKDSKMNFTWNLNALLQWGKF
jgi:hypothetical protein